MNYKLHNPYRKSGQQLSNDGNDKLHFDAYSNEQMLDAYRAGIDAGKEECESQARLIAQLEDNVLWQAGRISELLDKLAAIENQKPMCTAGMLDEYFLSKSGLESETPLYLAAGANPDAADAARYRYAMDWDTSEFAVCMRDGMSWTPVKTDGPIDAAMSGSGDCDEDAN